MKKNTLMNIYHSENFFLIFIYYIFLIFLLIIFAYIIFQNFNYRTVNKVIELEQYVNAPTENIYSFNLKKLKSIQNSDSQTKMNNFSNIVHLTISEDQKNLILNIMTNKKHCDVFLDRYYSLNSRNTYPNRANKIIVNGFDFNETISSTPQLKNELCKDNYSNAYINNLSLTFPLKLINK